MSHVQAHEITAALATGKPVWSQAIGRMGRITRVDGRCIELRPGRLGRGRGAITWFHQGDEVELVELQDKWVIRNTFAEVLQLST